VEAAYEEQVVGQVEFSWHFSQQEVESVVDDDEAALVLVNEERLSSCHIE
jgi:hypothetical protein